MNLNLNGYRFIKTEIKTENLSEKSSIVTAQALIALSNEIVVGSLASGKVGNSNDVIMTGSPVVEQVSSKVTSSSVDEPTQEVAEALEEMIANDHLFNDKYVRAEDEEEDEVEVEEDVDVIKKKARKDYTRRPGINDDERKKLHADRQNESNANDSARKRNSENARKLRKKKNQTRR